MEEKPEQSLKSEAGSPDESRGEPVKMVESPQTGIPKAPKPEPPINFEDRLAMLEQGQRIADKNFEILQDTLTKLEPLVAAVAATNQQAQQQTPTLPGGNLQVPPWLQSILSGVGGGGGDEGEFKKMAMDMMKAEIDFSRTFKNLFLAKFGGSTASDMAKAATG